MNLFKQEEISAWEHIKFLCETDDVVQAWLKENARKTYPRKTALVGGDPTDRQAQAIYGDDVMRKIEAVYFSSHRPLAEVVFAKLGLDALLHPGIDWILGPDSGTRVLQQHGRIVYNYLYTTAEHFEGVSGPTMFIAAHKFCDKHDENFLQWTDRKTGRICFYANTGAYFDVTEEMAFNHSEYIPPIHGCYGFQDSLEEVFVLS